MVKLFLVYFSGLPANFELNNTKPHHPLDRDCPRSILLVLHTVNLLGYQHHSQHHELLILAPYSLH
jgi:hypothetical protein